MDIEKKEDEVISSVPANLPVPAITLDQRAVMLASAVSIDFDYFTRSRGGIGSGMGMWMPIPMGGGTTTTEAGAAGEAGAIGGMATDESEVPPVGRNSPEIYPEASEERSDDDWSPFPQETNTDSGGWSDEVMQDPWAEPPAADEAEGGTWGWDDLFGED
jgi:hypothetical protein